MKRKIFSKLLMVAMLVASVSSFVSCKDYDDDINNLQDQINKAALQSELAALQQTVANNATAAKAAADAAEAAAKKYADELAAKSTAKADDLEKLIAQVKAVADAAATKDDLGKVEEIAKAAATQAALTEAIAELNGAIEKVKAVADAAATKEELAKAQEELKAAIKKVEDAAAEAKTLAQKAQETADKANTDLAAEVKRAKEAEEKLDAAIKKALEDAKKYTDDALTASKKYTDDEVTKAAAKAADELAKAIAKVYTKTEVDALIADAKTAAAADAATKLANALGDLGTATVKDYVNTQIGSEVADLKEELADTYLTKADFEKITGVSGSLTASVDALYSAVTSVELISSYSGTSDFNLGQILNDDVAPWSGVHPINLTILHGIIGETSKFGDNEAISKGTIWATATNPMDFAANDNIEFESGIIVRVSPSNADLTKSNAKILLVNSLGEGLDDYVVAGTPVRYDELITTTRATKIETGLWVIPFKVVEGVDEDAFEAETAIYNAAGMKLRDIEYAVAISNTTGDERYAISSYDVNPAYETYVPAFTYGFYVDETPVEDIRNRWDNVTPQIDAEQATKADNGLYELLWRAPFVAPAVPLVTPATAVVGDVTKNHATDPNANAQYASTAGNDIEGNAIADVQIIDSRTGNIAFPVEVNKAFVIDGLTGYRYAEKGAAVPTTALNTANYYYTGAAYVADANRITPIKAYYVVLDEPRAIESEPSEINAWRSYEIDGLNTITDATEPLEITIKSASANGDIIGFRVFAVNYDGTLADPDGRAFYVQVGDPANTLTVSGEYLATLAIYAPFQANDINATNNKYVDLVAVDGSQFTDATFAVGDAASGTVTLTPAQFPGIIANNVDVHYTLLKSDKKTVATKWNEIRYVAFSVDRPGRWVDLAEAQIVLRSRDAVSNRIVNQLTVKIKKIMPSSATGITWRATLGPVDGVLTVYPMPSDATHVPVAANGTQAITYNTYPSDALASSGNFVWATKALLPAANVTSAVVDLGGYANMVGMAATYDWYVAAVEKTTTDNDTDLKILGNDDLFTQFVMATAPKNVDSKTQHDSHIDATFAGIKRTSTTAAASDHVVPNIWSGKVVFASIFQTLVNYTNATYMADIKDAVAAQDVPVSDYYYFYDNNTGAPNYQGWLFGKYDETTAGKSKLSDLTKRNKYYELTQVTGNDATAVAATWETPAAATAYPLVNLMSTSWKATKLTNQLKAANAGLGTSVAPIADAALINYLDFTGAEGTISGEAATLINVNTPGGNLVITNKLGYKPTGDVAGKIAIGKVKDQFGVAISGVEFNFTIKPQTAALNN